MQAHALRASKRLVMEAGKLETAGFLGAEYWISKPVELFVRVQKEIEKWDAVEK